MDFVSDQLYNGKRFRALDAWAYFNKIKRDYSRAGMPTDNPHIESFNGSSRDECPNMNWFMLLEVARDKVERWRRGYNEFRPLYLTPTEVALKTGPESVCTTIHSHPKRTILWGTPHVSQHKWIAVHKKYKIRCNNAMVVRA
jgi:hypothetical protein